MGGMYKTSMVPVDFDKATQCYTKTANYRSNITLVSIDLMHCRDYGIQKDDDQVLHYFEKVIDSRKPHNGHTYHGIGLLYFDEQEIKQDHQKAIESRQKSSFTCSTVGNRKEASGNEIYTIKNFNSRYQQFC
jgi:TPR repeat protein